MKKTTNWQFNVSAGPLIGKRTSGITMTIRTKISMISILLVLTIGTLQTTPVSASASSFSASKLTTLASGVDSDKDEQPEVLRELQLADHITLPIVRQPHGNTAFVSPLQDYLTEYQTVSKFGAVGLLAHNYLAGRYFAQIRPGQEISLVYSDDRTEKFVVTEIHRYQALEPDSPSSDFVDLTNDEHLTASELFMKVYGNQSGHLILQTCIESGQNPSWGRLFIIAEPADPLPTKN